MAAITRPGTGIGASTGSGMVPLYWDSVFAESLYPNLFFYQFGAKRKVPPNFGLTVKISRLKRQTGKVAVQDTNSYGVPVAVTALSGLCAQVVSGTLKKFRGVYGNSDIALLTTLGDPTEFAIRDLARDLALQMDNAVRGALSAISQGRYMGARGTAYGSVKGTNVAGSSYTLRISDVYRAVAHLRNSWNPRWPDGNFPLIINPLVGFDIKSGLSAGLAGAWVDVNKYATEGTVSNIYRGEMGRIGGARFIEADNVKRLVANGGMSAGNSGYQNLLLAPEAYYVVEMDQMSGRIIVKGLGSAGALDADNSLSTVAAKVFFCPIRGFQSTSTSAGSTVNDVGTEARYIRLASAVSIY